MNSEHTVELCLAGQHYHKESSMKPFSLHMMCHLLYFICYAGFSVQSLLKTTANLLQLLLQSSNHYLLAGFSVQSLLKTTANFLQLLLQWPNHYLLGLHSKSNTAKWTEWNWRIHCFHFCMSICVSVGAHETQPNLRKSTDNYTINHPSPFLLPCTLPHPCLLPPSLLLTFPHPVPFPLTAASSLPLSGAPLSLAGGRGRGFLCSVTSVGLQVFYY